MEGDANPNRPSKTSSVSPKLRVLRVNRPEVAEATLDYYHASQHLGVLADFLFAHEKDASAKKKEASGISVGHKSV